MTVANFRIVLQVLNESTWATILLLIVGDLVTGHADIIVLYRMLKSFLDARGPMIPRNELEIFLLYQSNLFSFFAAIMLSEPEGVRCLSSLPDAVVELEGLNVSAQNSECQIRIRLYNEAFRRAAQIYLHRTQSFLMPGHDFQALEMLDDLRDLLLELDPTAQGAHTLVWPYFIAAADSSTESHRQFFLSKLLHIEQTTGFRNVSVAIEKLPEIWREQRNERWTLALPKLLTVVM